MYFHHGLFGAPSMYRTAAMNVSSRQGSWRWPVIRHNSSYSAYGSRPGNPAGVGEGGWVDLPEPITVRAGEAFIAVPEEAAGGGT